MLKRALILLVLALIQIGCNVYERGSLYEPLSLLPEERQGWERLKREFVQIEDIKVGDGALAAFGRKIFADIRFSYSDGTMIYSGPAISYAGMQGTVFIHNSATDDGLLSLEQQGIILGLNGMAVGGKRRIIVLPNLVCYEGAVGESVSQGAVPNTSCRLVRRYLKNGGIVNVRKEKLIIGATLTDSCIPVFLDVVYLYRGDFRCRNTDSPRRDPAAPTWHIY